MPVAKFISLIGNNIRFFSLRFVPHSRVDSIFVVDAKWDIEVNKVQKLYLLPPTLDLTFCVWTLININNTFFRQFYVRCALWKKIEICGSDKMYEIITKNWLAFLWKSKQLFKCWLYNHYENEYYQKYK